MHMHKNNNHTNCLVCSTLTQYNFAVYFIDIEMKASQLSDNQDKLLFAISGSLSQIKIAELVMAAAVVAVLVLVVVVIGSVEGESVAVLLLVVVVALAVVVVAIVEVVAAIIVAVVEVGVVGCMLHSLHERGHFLRSSVKNPQAVLSSQPWRPLQISASLQVHWLHAAGHVRRTDSISQNA